MVRIVGWFLSWGLIMLGVAGTYTGVQPAWFLWLDFVAGVVGVIAVGAVWLTEGRGATPVAILLAIGAGVLFIIGLATHATTWLTWSLFAWACAFLVVGIARGVAGHHGYVAEEF